MSNISTGQLVIAIGGLQADNASSKVNPKTGRLCSAEGDVGQQVGSSENGLAAQAQGLTAETAKGPTAGKDFNRILAARLSLKVEDVEDNGTVRVKKNNAGSEEPNTEAGVLLALALGLVSSDLAVAQVKTENQAGTAVQKVAESVQLPVQKPAMPKFQGVSGGQKEQFSGDAGDVRDKDTAVRLVADAGVSGKQPPAAANVADNKNYAAVAEQIKAKAIAPAESINKEASPPLPQTAMVKNPEAGEGLEYSPAEKKVQTDKGSNMADMVRPLPATGQRSEGFQISSLAVSADKVVAESGESGEMVGKTAGTVQTVSASAAVRGISSNTSVRPAEQILSSIQANLSGPTQQIRLTLTPPELGMVRITFRQDGQEITGLLEVQRPQVRRDIEQAAGQLITAMNQAGVNVRRIDVVDMSSSGQNGLSRQDQQSAADYGDNPAGWQGETGGSDRPSGGNRVDAASSQLTEDLMQQWVTDKSLNMYI